jgi:hypothetical protein
MRFEGELNNSLGPALAPGVVNTRHEITEGQWPFPGIGFHLRALILMIRRGLIAKVRLGNHGPLLKSFWQCSKIRMIQWGRIHLLLRLRCRVLMHVVNKLNPRKPN